MSILKLLSETSFSYVKVYTSNSSFNLSFKATNRLFLTIFFMSEIVEPNPLLIEYFLKVRQLSQDLKELESNFKEDGEWPYIESNIEFNIFLLKRLSDLGLLPKSPIKICDCGIGLATIMYDLYLQSGEFSDIEFEFWGVEKYLPYIDAFSNNLSEYWNGNLNIVSDDLMAHCYTPYNFIWIFTPYSQSDKLMKFFDKVISEMPLGGIVFGLDHYRIMTYGGEELKSKFMELEAHKVDELWCFRKV